MLPVFLLGGGRNHPAAAETYGRFLQAATTAGRRQIALVVVADDSVEAEGTFTATRAAFLGLGVAPQDVAGILLSSSARLTTAQLEAAAPTGVFVCGGLTPLYQQVLCEDTAWLDHLHARKMPYGGFSAGAAIAATQALVGGWQAERGGQVRPILDQDASEDLDLLEVRPGLGLVPFTVEVHASQWGTLSRLLHAVDLGRVTDGWAIDENTLLQVDDRGLGIHGAGHVYHVRRAAQGGTEITIHCAPAKEKEPPR